MSQTFIDPGVGLMLREAAAGEWGKAAADAAKAKKIVIGHTSIDLLLDETESLDLKKLRKTDPAGWQEIRARAADQAEQHSRFMSIWG